MRLAFLNLTTALVTLPITTSYALTTDQVGARQIYMVDYDTGAVLMAKDENIRMPTASMSKVMTMYLVFEALKSGRLKLDDTLPVSEKAWRMQGSKMFVHVGDRVKVEDLIRGVIIQSGNDATIVLAEGLAGSEEAFAIAMNETAQKLGMKDSNFTNASGWPDPNHYSTAHDLTVLAKALIADFPEYYKYYSEHDFTYNKIKQGNRNPLLYRNIGGDGIKTGHTSEAGYGLIGSGVRDGRRVVFVMGGTKDMQARADESTKLLSWGLGGFVNLSPYENGETVKSIPVVLGQAPLVNAVVGQDFKVTMPRLARHDIKIQAEYQEPLVAPLDKGDRIGTLHVQMAPDQPVMQLPLVAGQDVPALGWFARTMAKAIYAVTGKGL
jgi:D-alanyl-D-alanine carboxypeptidase (penicillin-binding protein 5/6)